MSSKARLALLTALSTAVGTTTLAAIAHGAGRADEARSAAMSSRGGEIVRARSTTADDNPHWSGYVVTGHTGAFVSYTSVTGTWTVPTVTCTPDDAGASSAVWVGLGGYNNGSNSLEQVGIDANCDKSGRPTYFAWHELLPDIARNVKAKVFAGDTITGSVNILGPALVELRVRNQTRHWTFTQKINWGTSDTSSAEWILEAPMNCRRYSCHQARLANFGSVTMTRIAAVGNSALGTLTDPEWKTTLVRLVPGTGPTSSGASPPPDQPGAAPGEATQKGDAFDVSWVADVTTGG